MKRIDLVVAGLALCGLLAVSGCDQVNPRVATKLNEDATLTGGLPLNPASGKVITSWVDRSDKSHPTMSTLYGNDVAVHFARTNAGHDYPAGSVLSLVTWDQQEDERWFGGNIPAAYQSVEVVTVGETPDHSGHSDRGPVYAYQRYEGAPLKLVTQAAASGEERVKYLLAQRAAVMP